MHYSLPNDLPELSRLARWLEKRPEIAGLQEDQKYILQLALEEMVSNIIKYGFDDSSRHDIDIDIAVTPEGELRVTLADDGHPFDPLSEASKTPLADDLAAQQIGGVGVHLVKQLTDDLRYRRDNGRNILEFNIKAGEEHHD